MSHRRWWTVTALLLGAALAAPGARAESSGRLAGVRSRIDSLTPAQRALLTSSLRNISDASGRLDALAERVAGLARPNLGLFVSTTALTGGKVSDPADDARSPLGGFTQALTSTAWCSPNVVVAFEDTGSELASLGGPFSNVGYSRSTNSGITFFDLGFPNPGPDPNISQLGQPSVGCTDAQTFYLASLSHDSGADLSTISLSLSSTNNGTTFATPVSIFPLPADQKPAASHTLDKVSMAVAPDPANPTNRGHDQIFITYTDIDISGTSAGCPGSDRWGVEMVQSTDGGVTFSSPKVVWEVCDPDALQGSQVVVGNVNAITNKLEVYVAWEAFPATSSTRVLQLSKSTDGGGTFSSFSPGSPIDVVQVVPVGGVISNENYLQGAIRANEYPSIAVDRSSGIRKGWVFITWADGRDLGVVDASPSGIYNFADILLVRSSDGGTTFNRIPVRVNTSVEPLTSFSNGADQFAPAAAVDKTGTLGVCFYDRRRDGLNFLIDRECGRSIDGGNKWTNKKVTLANAPSSQGQDMLTGFGYQGGYDSLTTDGNTTKTSIGIVGGYAVNLLGNLDVRFNKP
jgi:hypothetical protein